MKIFAPGLLLLLTSCVPHGSVLLPSQRVDKPKESYVAGCYVGGDGGRLLLRDDRTAKNLYWDGTSRDGEHWYIHNGKILFGPPDEFKFYGYDVYLVPGSGYVLADGTDLMRHAKSQVCGL